MPKKHEPEQEVETYGYAPGHDQITYDLTAFLERKEVYPGYPSRPELFRRIAEFNVPGWFEWHEWTNKIVDTGCSRRWSGITGCTGSTKTRNVAGFACNWWMVKPDESSVVFCSTTMGMLRKRGWAEVQRFYQAYKKEHGEFGNFVNSRCIWQSDHGDDKCAIFGKAVAEGNVYDAAADIQGIHTKRQMIVIDEAPAVPAAIWKVIAGLYAYCANAGGEFILFALGNARNRLDQFGRFIEPAGGWPSVSKETDEWEGKPYIDGTPVHVIRFDFRKSPRIADPKCSAHLHTKEVVEQRLAHLKSTGGENDPEHWCYDLGFPAPEGLSKTVFTESLFEKFKAYDRHTFTGRDFIIIGAFDPAYTGDRPAVRFAALGDIGFKKGIEWCGEPILLFLDAESKEPPRYQYLRQIRSHCQRVDYRGQQYECYPQNFGFDITGDGGVGDIARVEWSQDVILICFSASPTEEPCSHEDERLAKDVYANMRSEMYYRTRNAVQSEQLKGVDKDTAAELCTIEEDILRDDGTTKPRIVLQSKKEYKLKFNKSPDLADVGCMLTRVAQIRGFVLAAVGLTTQRDVAIEELIKKSQAPYQNIDYSAENEDLDAVFYE